MKIVINITFSTFFQNVGSANYIHVLDRTVQEFEHLPVGQKYWVFIPRYHAHLFKKLCDIILRDLNYLCPNYLAHRFLMANPQFSFISHSKETDEIDEIFEEPDSEMPQEDDTSEVPQSKRYFTIVIKITF